jgi:hypothetical protein
MLFEITQLSQLYPKIGVNRTCPVPKESVYQLPYPKLSMAVERTPTTPDSLVQLPDHFFNDMVSLDVADSLADINYDLHNEEDGDSAEAHRTKGGELLEKLDSLAPNLKHLRLLGTTWAKFQDSLALLKSVESLEIEKGFFPDPAKLPPSLTELSIESEREISDQNLESFIQNLSQGFGGLKSLRLRARNPFQGDQVKKIVAAFKKLEYFASGYQADEQTPFVVDHPNLRQLAIIGEWGDDRLPAYHPGLMPRLDTYLGGYVINNLSKKKTSLLSRLRLLSQDRAQQSIDDLTFQLPYLEELLFPLPTTVDLRSLHKFSALHKLVIEGFTLQNSELPPNWLAEIPQLVELHLVDAANLVELVSSLRHKHLRVLAIEFRSTGDSTPPSDLVNLTLDATTLPSLTQLRVEAQFDIFRELSITGLQDLINVWITNTVASQKYGQSGTAKVGTFAIADCGALKLCALLQSISSVKIERCPQLQYVNLNEHKKSKKISVVGLQAACATFGIPAKSGAASQGRARGMGEIFGFDV